jgi:hypothetical protein
MRIIRQFPYARENGEIFFSFNLFPLIPGTTRQARSLLGSTDSKQFEHGRPSSCLDITILKVIANPQRKHKKSRTIKLKEKRR